MRTSTKHSDGPEIGSDKVVAFADSLTALASELREADIASREIRELAATLSSHANEFAASGESDSGATNAVAVSWVRTAVGRAAAVAATLILGTGGLGVAGALPAPMQHAFDSTIFAIGSAVFGEDPASDALAPSSHTPSDARSGDRASVARGPVLTESQATTSTPDPNAPGPGEDPLVGDEHRSPTSASVTAVIASYDKTMSEAKLGALVSDVASGGKAGGGDAKVATPGKLRKATALVVEPARSPSETEQLD